jgi:hypothetical protein
MSSLLERGEREGRLRKCAEEQIDDVVAQVGLRTHREREASRAGKTCCAWVCFRTAVSSGCVCCPPSLAAHIETLCRRHISVCVTC